MVDPTSAVTASATDAAGNTSEFSPCFTQAPTAVTLVILATTEAQPPFHALAGAAALLTLAGLIARKQRG